MSFLHPTLALVGLAAISLPIIIHLLIRRRVKPIRWAAMKFLMQAYKQRRRRLILEQLLLLAARCLLVALIALAIARLMLGSGVGAGIAERPTALVLMIDDSLTAGADGALERLKDRALALLSELDPGAGDTVALVTLSAPASGVVLPPSSDIGAVRAIIQGLAPTDCAVDLPGAAALIGQVGDLGTLLSADGRGEGPGPRVVVAVLSEFLAGSVDVQQTLSAIQPRPDAVLVSTPRATGVDNVAIVSVEPLRSVVTGGRSLASSNQARVTLRRSGPSIGQSATRSVRLLMPEEGAAGDSMSVLDEGLARFEPGQAEATLIMRAETGPPSTPGAGRVSQAIVCQIEPDALPGDDVLRRVVEFRDSIRVAVVSPRRFERAGGIDRFDAADWATLALEPMAQGGSPGTHSDIEVARVEPGAITTARLAGFDAAILCAPQSLDQTGWEALASFVRAGGLLVLIPPADATTHVWTDQIGASLGLSWEVSREAVTFDAPRAIQAPAEPSSENLLALVGAEIPELARAVGVRKRLNISMAGSTAGADTDESARRAAIILSLDDGEPFLIAERPGPRRADPSAPSAETDAGRGLVVMLASSLDLAWTDLPAKPLVVPVLQEIVRQGVGLSRGSWASVAGQRPALPEGAVELRVIETDDRIDPQAAATIGDSGSPALRHAGLYRAIDASGATRATLVVAPDHRASDTGAVVPATVTGWIGAMGAGAPVVTIGEGDPGIAGGSRVLSGAIKESNPARDVSFPLLLGALAIAIAELIIARWSSHARRLSEGGAPLLTPGARGEGRLDGGAAA